MRKCILTVLFILLVRIACADAIYFKNGQVLRGKITKVTGNILVIEIEDGSREVKKEDVLNYALDELDQTAKIKSQTSVNQAFEWTYGTQAGIFLPKDTGIRELYDYGLTYGLNFNLWLKTKGGYLELEHFQKKAASILYTSADGIFIKKEFAENITLTSAWLSYLQRISTPAAYLFYGIGTGAANITKKRKFQNDENEDKQSGVYPGYQLLLGIKGEFTGVTVKYNIIKSNDKFDNIDFGGFSGSFNLYFK